MDIDLIAWLITAFCVYLSARTANKFLREKPRLFTAMALFALVWALLLPYYQKNSNHSELFAAYGGFLTIYIGGLLLLEAKPSEENDQKKVTGLQRAGLWVFLIIASSSVLGFEFIRLNRPQTELVVSTILDICGYVSIVYGFNKLSTDRSLRTILFLTLVVYSLAEAVYVIDAFSSTGNSATMSENFKIVFAVLKIVFTVLFCYGVFKHTHRNIEKPIAKFIDGLTPWG
ncbi:MAG TPA: hypothetical protein VGQ09_00030 [Chitinophagaceae bacterium]|jgi:hypothetical protein|nr:hypothetical protein [Chitinophagaceae bacterium]